MDDLCVRMDDLCVRCDAQDDVTKLVGDFAFTG